MEEKSNNSKRKMTTREKVQLSMSFSSPVLVFLFFIVIFVSLVKFDKNGFYPSYDLIKSNYALLNEQKLDYSKNIKNDDILKILNERRDAIEKYNDIYNEKMGFIKNQSMVDLRHIYNGYLLKLNEINKNIRHKEYLSDEQYEDVIDLLPTEKQMIKINDALPKPFFITFLKSVVFALLLQIVIYNIVLLPFKLIERKNNKKAS